MKAPPRHRSRRDRTVVAGTPHVENARRSRPRGEQSLDIGSIVGRSLLFIGTLSFVFGFFQLTIAGVSERRAQRALRGTFEDLLRSGSPLGVDETGEPKVISPGEPVALLEIPALGVRKVVVEGATGEILKRGPGHLRTSSLPGQPGHSIIVGRRTTYGGPFRRIDALKQGDEMIATTPYGRFTFAVRTVGPLGGGAASRLENSENGLLTIVTSDPAYTPNRALVVDSELTGEPSTFPDPPRIQGDDGAVTFSGNVASLPGVALSGILLFGAFAAAHVLYKRWRRWPTYLLTTPPILALLYAWMEGLVSILPSTL